MENLDDRLLFEEYKKGKVELENVLVEKSINLVYFVINRYFNRSYLFIYEEEMFSEGLIGLLNAIRNFDYKSDSKFSPFAVNAIKWSISGYLKRELSKIETISLQNTVKKSNEKTDTELEQMVEDPYKFEDDMLNNAFVMAMLKNLSQEDQKIAYLYFIKEVSKTQIAEYFNMKSEILEKKLVNITIYLRNYYNEMDLSKEEIIYRRFMKLKEMDKKYFFRYMETSSYNKTGKELGTDDKAAKRSIDKSVLAIGFSFEEIKDVLVAKKIKFECLGDVQSTNKYDYMIINRFIDLNERTRKFVVAKLSGDKQYYRMLLDYYEITNVRAGTLITNAFMKIGYEKNEMYECLKRNKILSLYIESGLKEFETFDLINMIYNELPVEIDDDNIQKIMKKYESFSELDKKIILLKLRGYTLNEINEFLNIENTLSTTNLRRRIKSLGNPDDVRLCLAKKVYKK